MPLTRLVHQCNSGACPDVLLDDDGTVLVKGEAVVARPGVDVTGGEAVVRIPPELLLEAADALRRAAGGGPGAGPARPDRGRLTRRPSRFRFG